MIEPRSAANEVKYGGESWTTSKNYPLGFNSRSNRTRARASSGGSPG